MMELLGTGEAVSFQLKFTYLQIKWKERSDWFIKIISHSLPAGIASDFDSKRKLVAKQKSQRITVLLQ